MLSTGEQNGVVRAGVGFKSESEKSWLGLIQRGSWLAVRMAKPLSQYRRLVSG